MCILFVGFLIGTMVQPSLLEKSVQSYNGYHNQVFSYVVAFFEEEKSEPTRPSEQSPETREVDGFNAEQSSYNEPDEYIAAADEQESGVSDISVSEYGENAVNITFQAFANGYWDKSVDFSTRKNIISSVVGRTVFWKGVVVSSISNRNNKVKLAVKAGRAKAFQSAILEFNGEQPALLLNKKKGDKIAFRCTVHEVVLNKPFLTECNVR